MNGNDTIQAIFQETLTYINPHINASHHVFPQIETHTVWGRELTFMLTDRRSVNWYSRYSHQMEQYSQEQVTGLLADHYWPKCRRVMPKDALVFDLGSNEGYLSCMFALHSGPKSKVISVEPLSRNVAIIRVNVALNKLQDNVIPLRAAVTGTRGERSWVGLHEHMQNTQEEFSESVSTVTIDELMEYYGMPDLIKMDIEGWEVAALRGAEAVLAAGTAIWVIEPHENEQVNIKDMGYSLTELSERLRGAGYTLFCDAHEEAITECTGNIGHVYALPASKVHLWKP